MIQISSHDVIDEPKPPRRHRIQDDLLLLNQTGDAQGEGPERRRPRVGPLKDLVEAGNHVGHRSVCRKKEPESTRARERSLP